MIDVDHPMIELNAQDRCDQCQAQAYTLALKENWELLFCLHHRKQHIDALVFDGWEVIDDILALENLT